VACKKKPDHPKGLFLRQTDSQITFISIVGHTLESPVAGGA